MERLEDLLARFLKASGVPVSKIEIRNRLLTHPNYPSLLSITDTLTEIGIANQALVVDKTKISNLPMPFLAYTTKNDGEFVIVRSETEIARTAPNFMKHWKGVAVLIDSSSIDTARLKQMRGRRPLELSFIAILLIYTTLFVSVHQIAVSVVPILLMTLTGLVTSVLIVRKSAGFSSLLESSICQSDGTDSCDRVLKSKGNNVFSWLSWGDIGLIFFLSSMITLVGGMAGDQATRLTPGLALVFILPIAFVPYSLYYQWQIEKRWCRLCLLICAVLTSQSVFTTILYQSNLSSIFTITLHSWYFIATIGLVSLIWLAFVKPVIARIKQDTDGKYAEIRLKSNKSVFNTLLNEQPNADTSPIAHDIQLGAADAPIQLMMACNPYCKPCSQTHQQIHALLTEYPDSLGVTIRFDINASNQNNQKTVAATTLVKTYISLSNPGQTCNASGVARDIFHHWYNEMAIDEFSKRYPLDHQQEETKIDDEVRSLLQMHENWCTRNRVKSTPTLYINGHNFPPSYKVGDLKYLLRTY